MFLFVFVLGVCVGSFLNVLIYRLPRGLSLAGRSFCPQCRHKLAWRDNIPLLSFAFLGGRCRCCQRPISWQYPAVEFGTAVTTLLVFFHLAGAEVVASSPPRWLSLAFYLLVTYALIVIFVSDLKYQIIPDQIIYPAILLTALFLISQYPNILISYLLVGLGTAGFFLLLYLLTRGKGMGLGDVKLALLMGLLLGWPKILIALYFAFLTGAFVGVILILLGKKKFGQHIPFGPFLVGGTLISFLSNLSHL